MLMNTQVFLDNRTTAAARLRGVLGVHKNHGATNIHRFVAQEFLEGTKPSVVSRQAQVTIARHERQIGGFCKTPR